MFKGRIKILLTTAIFIVVTALCFSFIYSKNESAIGQCATPEPVVFCGNVFMQEPLTQAEEIGKSLFQSNCAACHKLNKLSTGPALRYKLRNNLYPSMDYVKQFITNEDALLKAKDSLTLAINAEFSTLNVLHNFEFSPDNLDALLEYIK